MDETRAFLESVGLPPGDLHELPDSPKRFPDGAQYRVEIPSVEGPRCLEAVLEEAERLDVLVHRVSQGSGVFLQTDDELAELARMGAEARLEISLFARPNAAWDTSAMARAPAGAVVAATSRGQEQVVQGIEDVLRAAAYGIRSVLIADLGLLSVFGEMRRVGELPNDMQAKISVMLPAANPAAARVLADLGATTLNLPTDLSLPQIAAIRAAVDLPLDIYVEAPVNVGARRPRARRAGAGSGIGRLAIARVVTLFTGQWADLPLEELAGKAGGWGFDGLELACWGDHFEVDKALADSSYAESRQKLLTRHGLRVMAIGAHLVGQCVCDPIDERHRAILPPEVWGNGEPEGVRQRAAERLKDTARAATLFGVEQVNGFTGSSVWHLLYSFPPNDFDEIERGYQDFAERWGPIMDVFAAEGVRFGLEVHPTEIAYDFVTTRKTLAAIDRRPEFGLNFDPSHFAHQFLDSAAFVEEFADRIYHVHVKDSRRTLDGRKSILASHLDFGEVERGWDFVSPGHGDVDFESLFRALNRIGYAGPLSIEWEDSGMDRDWGAPDALAFVRRTDFAPSAIAFDAAMQRPGR